MRRRKNDDKRVLKPRNNSPPPHRRNRNIKRSRKPRKTSRTTMFLIILALVAFVIGAGIGISMALGGSEESSEPQVENVTVEMTSNLSDVNQDYFDYDADAIDYNDKNDIKEYNLTSTNVSY